MFVPTAEFWRRLSEARERMGSSRGQNNVLLYKSAIYEIYIYIYKITCCAQHLLVKEAATVIWQSTAVIQSSNAATDNLSAVN